MPLGLSSIVTPIQALEALSRAEQQYIVSQNSENHSEETVMVQMDSALYEFVLTKQEAGQLLTLNASHGGILLQQYNMKPGSWQHGPLEFLRVAGQDSGTPRTQSGHCRRAASRAADILKSANIAKNNQIVTTLPKKVPGSRDCCAKFSRRSVSSASRASSSRL
jgi:hypothetical protein